MMLVGLLLSALAATSNGPALSSTAKSPANVFGVVRSVAGGQLHQSGLGFPLDTGNFVVDTTPIGHMVGSNTADSLAVAWNGTDYLVVWGARLTGTQEICAARVSGSGALLDSSPFVVCITNTTARCAVAWGESCYMVVFEQVSMGQHRMICVRVAPDGRVLDPSGIYVAGGNKNHYYPSIAFDGHEFVLAWYVPLDTGVLWEIRSTRVTTDGVVRRPEGTIVARPRALRYQVLNPSVSSDVNVSLVVWQSNQNGVWGIWGVRVDTSGNAMDSIPFLISDEASVGTMPSVALGDSSFLVVWNGGAPSQAEVVAKRVSRAGVVLDRLAKVVGRMPVVALSPAVTFDDTNFIVAWQGSPYGTDNIYAARVTAGGIPLDTPGRAVTRADRHAEAAAVAGGAGTYLVSWLERGGMTTTGIYVARITSDLTPLDSAFPVTEPAMSESLIFADQTAPDVAYDGHNYLVVWRDLRTGSSAPSLYGIRISPAGAILDSTAFSIHAAPNVRDSPAVAAGDSGFLVVWHDQGDHGLNILGARVTSGGEVLDPGGLSLTTCGGFQMQPTVAFDGVNFIVVWTNGSQSSSDGPLRGMFVDQQGRKLDSLGFPIVSGNAHWSAVAPGDSSSLVAWEDQRFWYNIGTARISSYGARLDSNDFDIGSGTFSFHPDAAWATDRWCVVWSRTQEGSIRAARLSRHEVLLDSEFIAVRAQGTGSVGFPRIAFDGLYFVIVWPDTKGTQKWDVCGATLGTSGPLADTFVLAHQATSLGMPAIAHGPNRQMLVVYSAFADRVNGQRCNRLRIWGRLYQSRIPGPPSLLWPPDGYVFYGPPVILWVDSTTVADTFEFRVQLPGGSYWGTKKTAPCCSLPDSLLSNNEFHWQCRIRNQYGWSAFSELKSFQIENGTGIGDPHPGRPAFWMATVCRIGAASADFILHGMRPGARLRIDDATGRKIREFAHLRDGRLTWDLLDEQVRRVNSGVYFVSLLSRDAVSTRKLLLLR